MYYNFFLKIIIINLHKWHLNFYFFLYKCIFTNFSEKTKIAKKAFRFKVLLKASIGFIYTNDILQISTHKQITASD